MVDQVSARVLVVDNDTASRLTLDVVLFCQGYEVATAANGEEALGWLMQRPFDLLIVDLSLPGMTGLELARCARQCQPSTQVLFLASGADCDSFAGSESISRFDSLPKSASPEAIVDRMELLLSRPVVVSRQQVEHARPSAGRLRLAS
jgi:DNA-binding response OmpR family regulator